MITLFAVDKKGGIKEWSTWVNGPDIHVQHGKRGGKLQEKVFTAKAKNVGRANATTPSEQALLEMQSRINKQHDKGYRPSIEEAESVSQAQLLPMLASDYTKVGHSISYPCYVSPKLDGVRCIARVDEEFADVTLTSRGGKSYPVPNHIKESLLVLARRTRTNVFDGELYIHGKALQDIISAVKKPNELTPELQYWIFDLPSELPFNERSLELDQLYTITGDHLPVVLNNYVESEEDARQFLSLYISYGFEGMILRNVNGMYEWNHRSRDLQKWKEFQDMEVRVVGYEADALDEAVYLMTLPNGLTCKAKPRGTHEYRSVDNVSNFLDKWVTVRYQQLTNDGNLQFPVIVGVRDCDILGNPME